MGPVMELLGADRQIRRLLLLSDAKTIRKCATPGLKAAIAVILTAQQDAVPKGLVDVRRALGSRLLKASQGLGAKAGAGVGKKMTASPKKRTKPGVGISGRNVHWYVLGTKDRETGFTLHRSKHHGKWWTRNWSAVRDTGAMPAHKFLADAGSAAAGTAIQILARDLGEALEKTWEGK